jgi:signal transduction histidine kinase
MQQQADGWQEPEVLIYSGQVALDLVSELESEQGPQSGTRTEVGPESAPGYLPWLETVAPRKSREEQHVRAPEEQDQGQSHSGTTANPRLSPLDPAESLAALLHDTRNMISAIDLYCDLLEEPSVLAPPFRHYAGELRLVGGASRRLLEKLSLLHLSTDFATGLATDRKSDLSFESRMQDSQNSVELLQTKPIVTPLSNPALSRVANRARVSDVAPNLVPHVPSPSRPGRAQFFQQGEPIQSLADELMANRNILSALAGPGIEVGLSISGGHRPIAVTGDDLTRILVNLCRNAADVMPGGGEIQVALGGRRGILAPDFYRQWAGHSRNRPGGDFRSWIYRPRRP